jgi:MFS transporter, DHA3 family, macrolide efflux protein
MSFAYFTRNPSKSHDALLFLSATFITNLGNGIQTITAGYVTLQQTNSGVFVGLLFLLITTPQVIVSLISGKIADRNNKLEILIACDVARAVIVGTMALAGQFMGTSASIVIIYLGSFCVALLDAVSMPVSNSFLNDVGSRPISTLSAQFETATQAGALLSVSIGGFVVAALGAPSAFVYNAITFVASATLLSICSGNRNRRHVSVRAVPKQISSTALPLRMMIPFSTLFALGRVVVTAGNSLLLILVLKVHGSGMAILGLTDALAGVGVLLASLMFARINRTFGDVWTALLGYCGCGLMIALQAHGGPLWLMACLAIAAVFFGSGRIAARSLVLLAAGSTHAGRCFGLGNAIGLVLGGAATVATSWLADNRSIQAAYTTLSLLLICITITCAMAIRFAGNDSSGLTQSRGNNDGQGPGAGNH